MPRTQPSSPRVAPSASRGTAPRRRLPAEALAALVLACSGAAPRGASPAGAGPPCSASAANAGAAATADPFAPDPFAQEEDRANRPVDPPPAPAARPTLIRHATVVTAAGPRYADGFVLIDGGLIAAVGPGGGPTPRAGTTIIDAKGRFVTPGIVDPHSHIGVYAVPETLGHDDGNELTDPIAAGVRAEDSFWPQDPAIERAVEGGVTTIGVLPGSGNLVGGRGVVVHLTPQRGARAMRLPGSPEIVKMACGENPKRTYREQKRAPSTRMGSLRGLRDAFVRAQKYAREWQDWASRPARRGDAGRDAGGDGAKDEQRKPPDRDLALETLARVLSGRILVEWHCYQADDMLAALAVADEFGFKVRAFHHALEAYKIRDVLSRRGIAVVTWDDWWGFKMEAYDGIPENLALVTEGGARGALHSDSPIAIQLLNQAAAKALAAGRAAGIALDDDDAVRWITANAAWALGVDDQIGTLEPGKRADVVVWSEDPLSTYARADLVYIDGALVLDRSRDRAPWSDFELGVRAAGPAR